MKSGGGKSNVSSDAIEFVPPVPVVSGFALNNGTSTTYEFFGDIEPQCGE